MDVWSAGIVLYMMLSGHQPFYSDNHAKVVHLITTEAPDMEKEQIKAVSEEARDLLVKMLNKNPEERPNASECLQHPWMNEQQFRISKFSNLLESRSNSVLNRASENLLQRKGLRISGQLSVA